MAKRAYGLIIFDLDGTLIDSKRDIANSINFALGSVGLNPLSETEISGFVGHGVRALIGQVLGSLEDSRLPMLRKNFQEHYDQHLLDTTQLYAGITELLKSLPEVELAVVSNKPHRMTEKILKGLNIEGFFKWVVGGDTYPVMKPNPQVLSNILAQSQKNRERLMVGDSSVDIQTGRACGIDTCGVTYGFRPLEELKAAGADILVHSVIELQQVLAGEPD